MKFFVHLLALLILLSVCISCNRSKSSNQKIADTTRNNAEGIVMDNDTLSTIFAAYITLKDDLVKSDSLKAKASSLALAQALEVIHGCEQTAMLSEELAKANHLKAQRMLFATISQDLIAMYKNNSLDAGKIYVMHCPMFNNKGGADWLSTSTQVKNPYFGSKMLTCGTVIKEID